MRNRPFLQLAGISKHYGGVHALSNVDLEIQQGTVHAIIGENGAGKSTLNSIISGVILPDDGSMHVRGARVAFRAPHEAQRHGITIIEQELSLLPNHTVLENVFFGLERSRFGFVQKGNRRRAFESLMEETGFGLDPDARIATLSIARQQQVEITRALARKADLIVMDEPTAALTRDESDKLLDVVRNLHAAGTTIIYVSHILPDVLDVADFVTVMRSGRVVETKPVGEADEAGLVNAMVGGEINFTFPDRVPIPVGSPVRLAVSGLAVTGLVEDVSFDIHAGEIVGLAGLIGSGRSELAHAIFGSLQLSQGTVLLDGEDARFRSPRSAIRRGVGLLPESRKDQGLFMSQSLKQNLSFAYLSEISKGPWILSRREQSRVAELLSRLDVRPSNPSAEARLLSGGNQQKVLFGKWLFTKLRVLLVDEPTRGVDARARRAIYEIIVGLAAEGVGILLISSDIDEVVGLSHRILVMRKGSIQGEYPPGTPQTTLMRAAFGAGASSN